MGDLKDNDGPFIFINSTDLTTGNRFSFTQPTFDLICSDVNSYPISRAVTASSAVPVLFNPIVLKNYGDTCHTDTHELLDKMLANPDLNLRQKNLVSNVDTLRDTKARPYIHLVDGGISDNLGLRAFVDWTDILGTREFIEQLLGIDIDKPREVALILVNAALSPERSIDQTAKKPSTRDMLSAVTDAQMLRYTLETQMLIQELVDRASKQFQDDEVPVNIHVILLSFKDVENQAQFLRLNAIQTTFELPDEQVDELIATGRELLRNNENYRGFLEAIGGTARGGI
jgi:NTE family protein